LDNKYCSSCSYPLAASAFEEIKSAEDMKLQTNMVTIREEMENKFQQLLAKIDIAKLG
jgi:integrase/recombinase XerD